MLAVTGWLATGLHAQVAISAIKGSGATSPHTTQVVQSSGVVTGIYFSSGTTQAGFWMQTPDALTDGNPATSEALYVNTATAAATVNEGDLITLTGTVS